MVEYLCKPKNSNINIYAVLPSDFDTQKYLDLNPDVANSGVDPEVHFITYGQFENRQYS